MWIKYGMDIVAALKLPNGTIYTGKSSHAKAMYSLLKDIPDPSQELLDNIIEGFIDTSSGKFYTREEYKLITT